MPFNGNLARNHFNFELFGLQDIRLIVNGEEMPYSVVDLTGEKKIDGYSTLFSGSGDCGLWTGTAVTACSVLI